MSERAPIYAAQHWLAGGTNGHRRFRFLRAAARAELAPRRVRCECGETMPRDELDAHVANAAAMRASGGRR